MGKILIIVDIGVFIYLGIILILDLCSLFYCSEAHCIIIVEKSPLSNEINHHIRTMITALIPYSMKRIQQTAQWIILISLLVAVVYAIYQLARSLGLIKNY